MRSALRFVVALVVALVLAVTVPVGAWASVPDCRASAATSTAVPACDQPLTNDVYEQGVADVRFVLVTGFGLSMLTVALVGVLTRGGSRG